MKWVDTTGYSRDAPRVPTTWSIYPAKELKITVTCSHIYYRDKWVLHCEPWYNTHPLGDDVITTNQAHKKALALVREKIAKIAAALNG